MITFFYPPANLTVCSGKCLIWFDGLPITMVIFHSYQNCQRVTPLIYQFRLIVQGCTFTICYMCGIL